MWIGIFKRCVKTWRVGILTVLLPLLLNSMAGCSPRYVVIDGQETMTISKQVVDRLYQDNERLLKALKECRANK